MISHDLSVFLAFTTVPLVTFLTFWIVAFPAEIGAALCLRFSRGWSNIGVCLLTWGWIAAIPGSLALACLF